MLSTKVKSIAKVAEGVVKDFLKAHKDVGGGAKVFSKKGWKDRGEHIGDGSLATMVFEESGLWMIFNGYVKDASNLFQELQNKLGAVGLYCELGYNWSLHVYESP